MRAAGKSGAGMMAPPRPPIPPTPPDPIAPPKPPIDLKRLLKPPFREPRLIRPPFKVGSAPRTIIVVLDPIKRLGAEQTPLKGGDAIEWQNLDSITHVIHFTCVVWPFEGARRDVTVVAGATSTYDPLVLQSGLPVHTGYDYEVLPELTYPPNTPQPPPDGPAVVVDG